MNKEKTKEKLEKNLQEIRDEWALTNELLFCDILTCMTKKLYDEVKGNAIKKDKLYIICLCRREEVGLFLMDFVSSRTTEISDWLDSVQEKIYFTYDGLARGGMAFFPDGHVEYTSRLKITMRKDPNSIFGFYICNLESEINPDYRVSVDEDELFNDVITEDDLREMGFTEEQIANFWDED